MHTSKCKCKCKCKYACQQVFGFASSSILTVSSERDRHAFFGSPEEDASDSEISCENGCNVSEQRRCKTCVPVSGSLPDAGWQISDLLLLLDHWVQLLLLLGHQGERGLGASKEEEDSLNPQTRCQEERRAFEEEAQYFNCDFL